MDIASSSAGIESILCGSILIQSNNKFVLICRFCNTDCYALELEGFVAHIKEHFPKVPQPIIPKTEDADGVSPENFSDAPANQNHPSKSPSIINTDWSDIDDFDSSDNLSVEEADPHSHEVIVIESDSESTEDEGVTSVPKVIEVPRRTKRKHALLTASTQPSTVPAADSSKKGAACSICGKIFTRKDNRDTHERNHSGKRPYECLKCPKSFGTSSNLSKHVKQVHTKDPRHKCTMCPESFLFKAKLDIHVRQSHLSHTDPKRYFACNQCDGKFDTQCKLTYHKSRKHGRYSPTFACDYCQLVFDHRRYIVQHMQQFHSEHNDLKCQYCSKTFAWSPNVRRHERQCVLNVSSRDGTE